jgi:hypothetical protein
MRPLSRCLGLVHEGQVHMLQRSTQLTARQATQRPHERLMSAAFARRNMDPTTNFAGGAHIA